MDTNTQKNFMGAASGGAPVAGQYMLQGYVSQETADTVETNWTVPDDVESVCMVCVGAGEPGERHNSDADGGDGGNLRYVNDVSVTPGETLRLGAGIGFYGTSTQYSSTALDASHSSKGGPSFIRRYSDPSDLDSSYTDLCAAEGGNNAGPNVGTGEFSQAGKDGNSSKGGNGGGAGGYTANDGGNYFMDNDHDMMAGGGVGLTGNNETTQHSGNNYQNNWGSGGASGWETDGYGGTMNGCYGGGGGGVATTHIAGNSYGAPGAVRIIWGENRSFPSNAQGVFKTASGQNLKIEFHPPIPFDLRVPYSGSNVVNRWVGIEIFDDTGTNLVASNGQGADYDGLPAYFPDTDYTLFPVLTFAHDLDHPRSPYYDFDDMPAGSFAARGGAVFTKENFEHLFDTDDNDYVEASPVQRAEADDRSDNDACDSSDYLTGLNLNETHPAADLMIKFDSVKTIKKIHFYIRNRLAWMPRCRILLDGNVIADDSCHFIDIDTDEGHNSTYASGGKQRLAVFEFT
tara:strand:+ start:14784 stop:16328 length:1545 start_codon:yes stop_codon:yes gene_type:complete